MSKKVDPIVERNVELLRLRSAAGVEKYGTTLADNKLPLRAWLNHALEETLDNANYLQAAMAEIDSAAAPQVVADERHPTLTESGALRQYLHNDSTDANENFVFAYDKNITDCYIAELRAAAPVQAQEPVTYAWRVGEFWSSARPKEKCLCLAEGDDIIEWAKRKDFIRWISPVTAQPVAVPCASSNAEHELHSLRLQVYEQGKRLVDDVIDPDEIEDIGARLCALTQVCTYCHGGGEDGDDADANGEGGWIGRCGKCSGTGINPAAPAAQGGAKDAERYRHLRSEESRDHQHHKRRALIAGIQDWSRNIEPSAKFGAWSIDYLTGEALDAAIDAAIAAKAAS